MSTDEQFTQHLVTLISKGKEGLEAMRCILRPPGQLERLITLAARGAAPASRKPKAPKLFAEEPKKATRWPADRPVPQDWLDSAAARRAKIGLPAIDLRTTAEEFVTYWPTVAGRHGCKMNWKLTFENRCLTARAPVEPYSRFAVIPGGKGTFEDATIPGWVKRLEIYAGHDDPSLKDHWSTRWGGKPGSADCAVPAQAIAIFEQKHGRRSA